MAYKNTAVTLCILAWDTVANAAKTGDSANLTLRAVGDGTEFTPSSPSVTEMDATNLKGVYKFSLTASENNYSHVLVGGISSTAGVVLTPVQWTNESNANAIQLAGQTITAAAGVTFPTSVASPTNITAATLGATGNNAIADAWSLRDIATGGSSSAKNNRSAMRALRCKQGLVAGTGTVYEEDGTTPAWEFTYATAARDPLSTITPTT